MEEQIEKLRNSFSAISSDKVSRAAIDANSATHTFQCEICGETFIGTTFQAIQNRWKICADFAFVTSKKPRKILYNSVFQGNVCPNCQHDKGEYRFCAISKFDRKNEE